MPCLRGIEVSLTTKPEDEQIPEYPHPEGTSARLLGVPSSCSNGQLSQPKAGPTVAVYIPVNTTPATPCKYIFFRLYMNARPIAAWGIDPTVRPKGKVVKSLWSPCRLYTDRIGFEGRNFVFLPGQEFKSVAEDGGLIEIQVFRAKERRVRAPKLEEFKFQENYGIALVFSLLYFMAHREEPYEGDEREEETEFYFLKSPPERFPAVPSNSGRVPQPSKALRDASLESYLQRPLPELPVGAHGKRSRRSSAASVMSATLSITPSLQKYAEEGSLNPEEVEVGVAQLVQLPPSESTFSFVPDGEPNPADSSVSDYEASPKSPGDFSSEEKLSPGRYLPTTGSGLERGIALLTSPKWAMFSTGARSRQSLPSDMHSYRDLPQLETTTSSESEWAVANPSPGRASLAENFAPRESNPQTIKKTGRSILAGLRKKKISGSPGKLAAMVFGREGPKPDDGGDVGQRAGSGQL
ncbi:hypothetical protein F5144DRAFT_486636 [Chaetomium tenue]|uniref:Uncharacterized protein n=1 Tax=Chaetomium tenue TaxID=1854479 RepID=A0ACB7PH92_9PEZI|nr:hypothetical protein F5144DRAFT_486636 [Chaetomium globosum]